MQRELGQVQPAALTTSEEQRTGLSTGRPKRFLWMLLEKDTLCLARRLSAWMPNEGYGQLHR